MEKLMIVFVIVAIFVMIALVFLLYLFYKQTEEKKEIPVKIEFFSGCDYYELLEEIELFCKNKNPTEIRRLENIYEEILGEEEVFYSFLVAYYDLEEEENGT